MMTIRSLSMSLLTAATIVAEDPIRLHDANRHYFLFRGKPTVLITSGEHYGAVLNLDFDYKRYLNTLASDRLNMTRIFTGAYREGPKSFGISENTLAPQHSRFISPWPRTDAQTAAYDGLGRFDLTRWNEAYFERLKDFMKQASDRGIVVELALFCPFYGDEMWNLSPMNARNNVNNIGNYERKDVYTLKDPAMQRVQDALVRKIVTELRDFDNVLYEICNEPYSYSLVTADWERHIAGVIKEAESGFPERKRHLITQNVANGSKKVPAPNPDVSVFNFHYSRPPLSVGLNRDLERPIGCNETGFDGQADATYRVQGWEFILAGGALYNNLDYSFAPGREDGSYAYPAGQPGGGSAALRKQLGILRGFMESVAFVRMSPLPNLVRQGVPEGASVWALGTPGKEYALYLHHGGSRENAKPKYSVDTARRSAELQLDLPPGAYDAQWVDTMSGKVVRQQRFAHKGGDRSLTSPEYSEDIALRIKVR